jgi:hypothetical protein
MVMAMAVKTFQLLLMANKELIDMRDNRVEERFLG